VFPALEQRLTFRDADLNYLANLCHNCGECLYACQYAPPHEFGINVPRTLAELRLESYEEYCWPRAFGAAFRRHSAATSALLVVLLSAVIAGAAATFGSAPLWGGHSGDFYRIVPHGVMVSLFGAVALFVVTALLLGAARFWRGVGGRFGDLLQPAALRTALRDAASLRHLHGGGIDCTADEQSRSPWRRWFHHCTVYGFALCFASTTVAAVYHTGFGWIAPYALTSLPVLFGFFGGLGLVIGPAGLYVLRMRRDVSLGDPSQEGLDTAFILLLFLTSVSGLLLLAIRSTSAMPPVLIVHLGCVLALFITLPYGKFVHGIYRLAALLKFALESPQPDAAADRTGEAPAVWPRPLVKAGDVRQQPAPAKMTVDGL
jgi:citrate/tricarballylate utilization protein